LKLFVPVDWDKNVKRTTYYQRRLQKVGEEFEGKVLFALANKESMLRDPSEYGSTDKSAEFLIAIEDNSKKYVFPAGQTFSVETVRSFVNDFLNGKLKSYAKSEPVPTSQGPVTTVVGTTFDDIVMDPTKNVLIEFYAPWCGHCKTLAPKYDELGAKFEGRSDVVIAKIDATANDWPKDKFAVSGFPTIFFKPAGKNPSISQYSGGREVNDMEKYVKSNSKKVGKDEL